ncbi:MAG: hypothetical protein AVDCRST_MAG70-766, partial [uncultured Thermomicrobiales bacterium]
DRVAGRGRAWSRGSLRRRRLDAPADPAGGAGAAGTAGGVVPVRLHRVRPMGCGRGWSVRSRGLGAGTVGRPPAHGAAPAGGGQASRIRDRFRPEPVRTQDADLVHGRVLRDEAIPATGDRSSGRLRGLRPFPRYLARPPDARQRAGSGILATGDRGVPGAPARRIHDERGESSPDVHGDWGQARDGRGDRCDHL